MWDARDIALIYRVAEMLGSRQSEIRVYMGGLAARLQLVFKYLIKQPSLDPIQSKDIMSLGIAIKESFEVWKREMAIREADNLEFVKLGAQMVKSLEDFYEEYQRRE